jgi:hypothetical protein
MAVFVDFEEEEIEPPQDGQPPLWREAATATDWSARGTENDAGEQHGEAQRPKVREDANKTSVTKALGCYP